MNSTKYLNPKFLPTNLLCEYLQNPVGIDVAQPRFSWEVVLDERGQVQTAYQILISSSIEKLEANVGDKWNSGKVNTDQSVNVVYKGKELTSGEKCYWKVRSWDKNSKRGSYSTLASFEMGLLKKADWQGQWIGADASIASPLLCKSFILDEKIKKARAYICGLGYYELYLNGKKVGDHVLDPNWTDYDQRQIRNLLYPFDDETTKRILYVTYDVMDYLRENENVVGVMLGNGWYNQRERTVEGKMWYGSPRLILQMNIEFIDGGKESIVSDGTWRVYSGPITFNNIYYGEMYDAQLEKDGWNDIGYDDSDWRLVNIVKRPKGQMRSQTSPPDKVVKTIKPVKSINPKSGIYVYDMGQNFSGWVSLRVKGQKGTKITLRFAEELQDDGMLDFRSTGGEEQIQSDTYILKGEGTEIYEPHFTWHGFRYVEVTGYPSQPALDDLEGKVVHSAVETVGNFTCSNPLFNYIQRNYLWSQLSNFHGGVPSDCPHRERLGYTGDGQVTAEAAIYNFNMAQFYTKWLNDIKDAQNKETGFVPHTAPFGGGGGGPAWGCAYVIISWYMYKYYGEKRILEEHYSGMKHWIEYLGTKTDNDYIIIKEEPGSWCLGDWIPPGERKLPETLVNTFYYGYVSKIMSEIAEVLGKLEDAKYYAQLADDIKEACNNKFLDKNANQYSIGCQGANVFPLALGIVPKEKEKNVIDHLIKNIMTNNKGHLDTGIFATPFMLDVLVDYGYADVAYAIMNQNTYPSYGYMIEKGATTLWECWEKERGSHNHPMFGSVSAWFYKVLAGINVDPAGPGFKKIIIKPKVIGDLTYAKASIRTIKGTVMVDWQKQDNGLGMKVTIPVNSTAKVHLPKIGLSNIIISEGGEMVWKKGMWIKDVSNIVYDGEDTDYIVFNISSGSYSFKIVGTRNN